MSQSLSQEELADRIYVTRQTIPNWENGRNYPDIRGLVLLVALAGLAVGLLLGTEYLDFSEEMCDP